MLKKSPLSTASYLIKQLPRAVVFVDLKLEIIHASDQWVSNFALPGHEVIGKDLIEIVSILHADCVSILKKCLISEPGIPTPIRQIEVLGNEKWLEIIKTAWHDDQENVIGWIIEFEDISQRIQNEIELDKLHILSAQMSEIGKIGLWEFDAKLENVVWSDMTKIIHEVPLDYVPSIEEATNFYKSGYSRNTVVMTIQKAIAEQTPWSEKVQLITDKGNEIWVLFSGKPIYNAGVFTGLIGTLQSIQSLTESESKTRENEYHLRTLIDNLPLNIFIKDQQSRKVLVNKAEMDFYGITDEKDILDTDDFAFQSHKLAEKIRRDDLMVMQELKPILQKEVKRTRSDGSKVVMLTSKIPLVNVDGSAYGLVGISLDITELKEKESKLKDLFDMTSLQNKKLLNFAHIVSHNLRSHSANFSMLLEFLKSEKKQSERQKLEKMLRTASDNLLDTLDDLNEVVDINSNKGIEKVTLPLNEKIIVAKQNLTALFSETNGKIINSINENVQIKAIPSYLESILMNLMTNALKYRHHERDPIIKLNTQSEGDFTVLSFEDNGQGIDMKQHGDKVFGMYKTFHNNDDAKGIGLYITKNQIEAMNGKITVNSEVGLGTTFKLYFNEKN